MLYVREPNAAIIYIYIYTYNIYIYIYTYTFVHICMCVCVHLQEIDVWMRLKLFICVQAWVFPVQLCVVDSHFRVEVSLRGRLLFFRTEMAWICRNLCMEEEPPYTELQNLLEAGLPS